MCVHDLSLTYRSRTYTTHVWIVVQIVQIELENYNVTWTCSRWKKRGGKKKKKRKSHTNLRKKWMANACYAPTHCEPDSIVLFANAWMRACSRFSSAFGRPSIRMSFAIDNIWGNDDAVCRVCVCVCVWRFVGRELIVCDTCVQSHRRFRVYCKTLT